jgi:hypothetical protein
MPAEQAGIELNMREGVPVMSFPKPKGQKLCTFLIDVQLIEVQPTGIRFQEVGVAGVGRVHCFRPNRKQVELLTPYLWSNLKVEVNILLPESE